MSAVLLPVRQETQKHMFNTTEGVTQKVGWLVS